MKSIILGTAGHIDHGKTSLIKALTGTDTDRLKEEKLRGITIELGFAAIELPNGQHLGIVDVPGHEKFVKNMVAGATGIDIVAMVIAADEGIMPQTREHMEICTLLGIRHGLIVLTKIDLVDEEWLELVLDDIETFVKGTFLENTPVCNVSAQTGQGLGALQTTLAALCADIPERSTRGVFRLPVDRVFSMKGFGTVITGTLVAGQVQVGASITIYPSGQTSKVRGIQVHNANVEKAVAGMRTAINFQGLDMTAIQRGDVVAHTGTLNPSFMVDTALKLLESIEKPLKNRTRVRFHTGTSEILGLLILLDRDELHPGERAVVQIRLDAPLALIRDDRFVIRSYSPVRTIGGGFVLNPIPPKHKRFKPQIVEGLTQLMTNDIVDIIMFHGAQSGYKGVSFADLRLMTNLSDKKLLTEIQAQLAQKRLIQTDKEKQIYVHFQTYNHLEEQILAHLQHYHQEYPLKTGMPKEELKSKLPDVLSPRFYNMLITSLDKVHKIKIEEETVRLEGHKVALQVDMAVIRNKILAAYQQSGLMPPYFKELGKTFAIDHQQAKGILQTLVDDGEIIKVKEDLFFHAKAIQNLEQKLIDYLTKNDAITTPQFKDMTGATRKYAIPLIEYFDTTQRTIRVGDERRLRRKN